MSDSNLFPNRQNTLKKIRQAKLYGILDTGYSDPKAWPKLAQKLISGGTGVLQIRAKGASRSEILDWTPAVLKICLNADVPLILNDQPELAYQLGTHGCHLGQDDMPLEKARGMLDTSQILGKSTHSLSQAVAGEAEGADYIGFGPIFSTPTKPDYVPIGLEEIHTMYQRITIPAFCIGGIKLNNLTTLIQHGSQRVVIVSGLLDAEDPEAYAKEVVTRLS